MPIFSIVQLFEIKVFSARRMVLFPKHLLENPNNPR